MSHLSKLTIKRVLRQDTLDPVQARRNKLLSAVEEQLKVAEAATQGKQHPKPHRLKVSGKDTGTHKIIAK